jgi:hypothetical protein
MLAEKGEAVGANTKVSEDFTMLMEPFDSLVHGIQGSLIEVCTSYEVTEIEKSAEGLHDCRRHEIFNCRKIHLK